MKKFSVFFSSIACVCFSLYFCKSDWFLPTPYLKWSTLLFSYLCSALYWLVSFLDSSKGQIAISVQTFPDNKNRRVKWCYKTRNRTKLKIYQRKTSTNPFFSQGIVFDHRSADLKKKEKQKNKLVALSTTPSLAVHSEMSFTNVCAVFFAVHCNLFILYLPPSFFVLPFQFGVSPFKTNILGCPSQFKYFFWPQQTTAIFKRSLVNDPAEMTLTNTHACVFYIL